MSSRLVGVDHLGRKDKFLSGHHQEDNPQNVAQVPQMSPASFPLSHLQDFPQTHRPVELSQPSVMIVVWTELALVTVMDTLALRCVAVLHVAA